MPIAKIVLIEVVILIIVKKQQMYLFIINIIMETIVGFTTQFFKSMMRPVLFTITARFRTKLVAKLVRNPRIYPKIPSFGTTKHTKRILML